MPGLRHERFCVRGRKGSAVQLSASRTRSPPSPRPRAGGLSHLQILLLSWLSSRTSGSLQRTFPHYFCVLHCTANRSLGLWNKPLPALPSTRDDTTPRPGRCTSDLDHHRASRSCLARAAFRCFSGAGSPPDAPPLCARLLQFKSERVPLILAPNRLLNLGCRSRDSARANCACRDCNCSCIIYFGLRCPTGSTFCSGVCFLQTACA